MSEAGGGAAGAPSRVHRPADALLAIIAAVAVAVLLGLVHLLPTGSRELTTEVSSFLRRDVPRVLALALAVISALGALVLAAVAEITLLRRDRRGALNSGAALAAGLGAALVGVVIWDGSSGAVAVAMLHGTNASILVAECCFVSFLTGTDLVRRPRWSRWSVISAVALVLTTLALADLTAMDVLVVPLGGWAVGLLVRWSLGASSSRPTVAVLRAALDASGASLDSLSPLGRGSGGARGTLADGTDVVIRLANHDTRGAGVARRLYASLRLSRAIAGHQPFSSRSQLEREALTSYMAATAGVRVPTVLALRELPGGSLMLALSCPDGQPPDGATSPEAVDALFASLRRLHGAGIAHRDLQLTNLVTTGDTGGFSSIDAALAGAGELLCRLDVAQLLVSLATVVGPKEAVRAMRQHYQPASDSAIAVVLQPIALASWGWTAMRAGRACAAEVRRELTGKDAEDEAPPIQLERFRWRTVLTVLALTLAAYVLVGQLSKVNLLGALRHLSLPWFALAVLASAITYLGAAGNLAAFVPQRLSLVRGFFVQLSTSFVGVAMPPTVGHVAVNGRYLHRQGVDSSTTAAAVAVSQAVNFVSTVVLLLVFGLLTGSGLSHLDIVPSDDILIALGVVAVLLAAVLSIPKTRSPLLARVWPHVRSILPRLLQAVAHPARLAAGLGGNLLLTGGYIVALVASLRGVGAHPAILATAAVYMAGNAVGSAAPTPGGLGAIEVVLTAGLTGIGIPAHEAVSAVLVYRAATFWLPIPFGWLSYQLLQRSGTL